VSKNIFRRHERPAQELEGNNSRFFQEMEQLELQKKMDSKWMENAGFVCSNTSFTATKLRGKNKKILPVPLQPTPMSYIYDFLLTPCSRVLPEKLNALS
jgi:hypothetical protein